VLVSPALHSRDSTITLLLPEVLNSIKGVKVGQAWVKKSTHVTEQIQRG